MQRKRRILRISYYLLAREEMYVDLGEGWLNPEKISQAITENK